MAKGRVLVWNLLFCMALSFAGRTSAQPQIEVQPTIKPAARPEVKEINRVPFPDYPQIRAFSLEPASWLMSETGRILFRWRVDPSPGGSAVQRINIARTAGEGPQIDYSDTNPNSQHCLDIASIPFIPEGRTTYMLSATDQKGSVSNRSVTFEVKSMSAVRRDISLVSLQTEPARLTEGAPFVFILRLNNRSGVRAPGVTIPVRGKDLARMEGAPLLGAERPPPNQGELRGQVINDGFNEYRIRCNGIPAGLMERYLFEIIPEYKTWSILNVSARVEYDGSVRVFERRFD